MNTDNEIIDAKHRSCASLAIECLVATGIADRQEAFKRHIANAIALGQMPDHLSTIRATLQDYSFIMQGSCIEEYKADFVIDAINQIVDSALVLLSLKDYVHEGGYMMAVRCKDHKEPELFCPEAGPENINRTTVAHVWVRPEDGTDSTPFPRKAVSRKTPAKKTRIPTETEFYRHYNPNPAGRYIGDCLIRAVAGALDLTWQEALERLASLGETTVNSRHVYPEILKREGFIHYQPIVIDGQKLSGKKFCEEMDRQYSNGECRIVAHVGRNHAAAIVPTNGKYMIYDSWDSSGRSIADYWVLFPKSRNKSLKTSELNENHIQVGDTVRHPSFGEGLITALTSTAVTIDFGDNGGTRRIGLKWVVCNCTRVAA